MRVCLTMTLGLMLFSHACAYPSPEEDHFACDTDDDCIDGYRCGGHTLIKGQPESYCVIEAEATVAVFNESLAAFGNDTEGSCNEREVRHVAWMVAHDVPAGEAYTIVDGLGPVWPQGGEDEATFRAFEGTCVGELGAFGQIQMLCRIPVAVDVDAIKSVAMFVLMLPEGTEPGHYFNRGVWLATSFRVGDLAKGKRLLRIAKHQRFDEHLFDVNDRCSHAAQRMCPANDVCDACNSAQNNCPLGFTCPTTGSACVYDQG
ncbi:hypothetical protein ACFL6C_01725 [Myxococcota bacterium]